MVIVMMVMVMMWWWWWCDGDCDGGGGDGDGDDAVLVVMLVVMTMMVVVMVVILVVRGASGWGCPAQLVPWTEVGGRMGESGVGGVRAGNSSCDCREPAAWKASGQGMRLPVGLQAGRDDPGLSSPCQVGRRPVIQPLPCDVKLG